MKIETHGSVEGNRVIFRSTLTPSPHAEIHVDPDKACVINHDGHKMLMLSDGWLKGLYEREIPSQAN